MEKIFEPTPEQIAILNEIEQAKQIIRKRENDIITFMVSSVGVNINEVASMKFDGQKVIINLK